MCLQARRLADLQAKAIGRTHLNSGYVQERRVEAHNDGAPGGNHLGFVVRGLPRGRSVVTCV